MTQHPETGPTDQSPGYERTPLSRELSALEATHSIEVLLFILDNEGCTRTAVYDSISRSTSVQSRMTELESVHLIESSKMDGSRTNHLHLTPRGRRLAEFLKDFNDDPGAGHPSSY